jgi:4-hydroxy-tetrahydrodipicolinate synthase
MNHPFHGIWVPIVTPFHHGVLDCASLARLAQHLAEAGISGIVAGATTGEGACLTLDELLQMAEVLREALPAGYPIVLGLNSMDTRSATAQARSLSALHPTGLLVTAPPYVRPTQSGIRHHFEAVAEAADTPIIVYDIPYRTGVELDLDTLLALSEDHRIQAIKSCGASVDRLMQLIHDTPLHVLIGEDSQLFAALAMGAPGAIAASAHYRPTLWVRIIALLAQGDLAGARKLAVSLQRATRALFAEPNPSPIKAWLAHQGWIANELRLPFLPAQATTLARLQALDDCLNTEQVW